MPTSIPLANGKQGTGRGELDARFCALYYPETICLDEIELKYLLLLYDRILFLPIDLRPNPGHTSLSKRFSVNDAMLAGAFKSRQDAYYAQMYLSEPSGWDDRLKHLMDLYDELEEKERVIGLQDKVFTDTNQLHPLKVAVDADMTDSDFVSSCTRHQNPKILIPRGDQSNIKGGGFVLRPPLYTGDLYIPSICSERINTTLFIAGRDNLFPVCGNRMYVDLLKAKLKRAALVPPQYASPPGAAHRFSMLSWEVATEVVPRNVIQATSLKDLLRYKIACIDLKQKFRSYLQTLEIAMTSEPWQKKFSRELDNIVKKEIVPEVQRIREQKLTIWEKLFGDSLASMSLKVGLPVLGIQLVLGLSFWEILEASTKAFGVATLKPLLDAWQEERKLRRNALFFLVRLNKS